MIEVIFLGTGGIKPTPERNVPGIAIKIGKEIILFDAGEGTLKQMEIAGLSPMRISRIFITHFHGDHYLGIPSLIQTMNLWHREAPLYIYGPPGTVDFIRNLLNSGYFRPSFKVIVTELVEGEEVKGREYRIKPFQVLHGIPAFGYVFKEKDRRGNFNLEKIRAMGLKPGPWMKELERKGKVKVNEIEIKLEDVTGPKKKGAKIVYTGDTEPMPLGGIAEDADLLIHDATYLTEHEKRDSYHSTVREACEVGRECGVELLVLFHRAPRYRYVEYKREALKICPSAYVPRDFDRILVGNGNVVLKVR
ncbi:ribonuclease Z [Thermococcus chitonophagus]|uniref:Ribonuclease Z n=1 Tax=Thermococcus chitonophagus TaxID=54262 RepID=A0A160VTW9_9EURY|nr:ribonuclease Z [Thermococcus chitonophagus]ASJ16768.1 ribonuclease Z [Thermococcus chitonophagus]CUX78239.1 Ribonuclease Z [Thermococcus chitonophagus]